MPHLLNLLLTGTVQIAEAQSLSNIADAVGNGLRSSFGAGIDGEYTYLNIADFLLERAWMVVATFTALLLVRSGIKLIYGQSEEKFEEAKRAIANGLMAVVLSYITGQIVNAFIRSYGGKLTESGAETGSAIFTLEILGIISWVQTFVAVLAIGMIVASVFTAMLSMGADDSVEKMRRAIFGAGAGIFILLLDGVFLLTFGLAYNEDPTENGSGPSATGLIEVVFNVLQYILGFMALIAVIMVIYAGIVMILSMGNEEKFKEMRSLIVRVLIGLVVILFSSLLIQLVYMAFA